ncbi:MAG TPA: hypothetical protein VL977_08380 [Solirubrobacteraceae bacterium]|nr:hypothetical protein [Solirubrobacteraceae bacterium]
MSDKDKKAKGKDPKGKAAKGKEAKGKKDDGEGARGAVSLAAHPRATVAIRSLKGWGGVVGFCLAAYLSAKAGAPLSILGMRAIVAGILGYMVAWCCGVAVWRAIVTAEVRAAADRQHRDGKTSKAQA